MGTAILPAREETRVAVLDGRLMKQAPTHLSVLINHAWALQGQGSLQTTQAMLAASPSNAILTRTDVR